MPVRRSSTPFRPGDRVEWPTGSGSSLVGTYRRLYRPTDARGRAYIATYGPHAEIVGVQGTIYRAPVADLVLRPLLPIPANLRGFGGVTSCTRFGGLGSFGNLGAFDLCRGPGGRFTSCGTAGAVSVNPCPPAGAPAPAAQPPAPPVAPTPAPTPVGPTIEELATLVRGEDFLRAVDASTSTPADIRGAVALILDRGSQADLNLFTEATPNQRQILLGRISRGTLTWPRVQAALRDWRATQRRSTAQAADTAAMAANLRTLAEQRLATFLQAVGAASGLYEGMAEAAREVAAGADVYPIARATVEQRIALAHRLRAAEPGSPRRQALAQWLREVAAAGEAAEREAAAQAAAQAAARLPPLSPAQALAAEPTDLTTAPPHPTIPPRPFSTDELAILDAATASIRRVQNQGFRGSDMFLRGLIEDRQVPGVVRDVAWWATRVWATPDGRGRFRPILEAANPQQREALIIGLTQARLLGIPLASAAVRWLALVSGTPATPAAPVAPPPAPAPAPRTRTRSPRSTPAAAPAASLPADPAAQRALYARDYNAQTPGWSVPGVARISPPVTLPSEPSWERQNLTPGEQEARAILLLDNVMGPGSTSVVRLEGGRGRRLLITPTDPEAARAFGPSASPVYPYDARSFHRSVVNLLEAIPPGITRARRLIASNSGNPTIRSNQLPLLTVEEVMRGLRAARDRRVGDHTSRSWSDTTRRVSILEMRRSPAAIARNLQQGFDGVFPRIYQVNGGNLFADLRQAVAFANEA